MELASTTQVRLNSRQTLTDARSLVRPDQPVIQEEARIEVKRALRQYAREQSARDVALYGASTRIGWNELQSRAGLPPHVLSRRLSRVKEHLKAAVTSRSAQPSTC